VTSIQLTSGDRGRTRFHGARGARQNATTVVALLACVTALAILGGVLRAAPDGARGGRQEPALEDRLPQRLELQAQGTAQLQQPSEVELRISGDPGTPPSYAVPDFIALTPGTEAIAQTVGGVLWNDLDFEREFDMVPRDTYATVPVARTPGQLPFDAWQELGADAVVFGTIRRDGDGLIVEVRLFNTRTRQQVFGTEYSGTDRDPRQYAHAASDDIHLQQRALRGVARTKLAFSSDRNRESVVGTVESRDVKEVYITDYDGANQQRITANRQLNITPVWSPDGRAIAYTSYRRGYPDVFIAHIYEGRQETPTNGVGQNFLPAWSPNGNQIAFTSNRDGNSEIYVMNVDGTGLRRVTTHPAIDVTPTWSPTGAQIAFTSDRSGSPQIYIVGSDGLSLRRLTLQESYADRPTWSPAPFNEIAFASRTGPGYDIKLYELATGMVRQITFGQGSNESPAFSPNGRHVAFTSTRTGQSQIFTVGRDGRNVRQVTRDGNNNTPAWSR
jgi:TolB protein